MPPKSNIELGSGTFYLTGLDESEIEPSSISETEYADEYKPMKIRSAETATFECELEPGHEWVLTYCRKCGWGFPITWRYALMYGFSGWLCPKCTAFRRGRVNR